MSKPKEVLKFAMQFVESGAPLDALVKDSSMSYCVYLNDYYTQVNNAGTMVNQRETTEDKLEKNFATNTLGKLQSLYHLFNVSVTIGTYILTTELTPALERSKFPRVVSGIAKNILL